MDFPEEDIDPIVKSALIGRTQDILAGLGTLLGTYREGRILENRMSGNRASLTGSS